MTDVADIEQRLGKLEAEHAVRMVVTDYFRICDDLGPHTRLDVLGDLFATDAVWEGKGRYEKAFGRYVGRPAIVSMIAQYCDPPHFAMTTHFLSSERIEIAGEVAAANWMMLQCSTYADGRSDLRSAAIETQLSCRDGTWRIGHFRSTNLFARRVDHWSDEAVIPVPDAIATGGSLGRA